MRIVSVNVGQVETLLWGDRRIESAINKKPVAGQVHVGSLGLAGDAVAAPNHHGGAFKAVYLYDKEYYAWWQEQLGLESIRYGSFGDNLTTDGIDSRTVRVGDRFQIGSLVLQAVGPRIPCFKLDAQFQRKAMLTDFIAARRPGFYCRVLAEGPVVAGDTVVPSDRGTGDVTILDIYDAYHQKNRDRERFLRAEVIDPSWRAWLEREE